MIVTLIPYCPTSKGMNLGFAYNELMARLRDDDWACFLDHDACFTTYDWYRQLEEITAKLTEPCVLTAVTNRVGSPWQLVPGVDRDNHSMDYHRQVGAAVQSAARGAIRDVTHESLMSGVVILLSKATWRRLGGFADGFLGVDNAIHQAARDGGCRVFLMEGVYVYHWYRADSRAPATQLDVAPPALPAPADTIPVTQTEVPAQNTDTGTELEPIGRSVWGRVHVRGHRILAIDRGVVSLASVLKARGPARLVAVELDGWSIAKAREHLEEVYAADDEGDGPDFPDGSFDGIVCGDLLERVRRPDRLLHRLRPWLAPGGRLLATVANARRLSVVEGLLAGRWTAADGKLDRRPIRFFTRREVEKLLYRAGFGPPTLTPLPGPGHAEWVKGGRPGTVTLGQLQVGGVSPEEAEEFYVDGYLVEAELQEPARFGTTSIVVLTHNQLDYTRQCLESLGRLTDEPYELIVVDNASTDGTVDYLQSLPGVRVIVNRENRGFPAAANQGIEAATGDQILLLNNDTILTTGWLRRMLTALHSDPKIGLVGPCSNQVSGAQQVDAGYASLADLDGFAWEWGKAHDRVVEDEARLIGFCLLIRRTVVEAIGDLDERFGIGCFEDDDYCLRAIAGGWRTVIALDAFVHHYGGRTFVGSGVDFAAIMRENERKFRTKWEGAVQAPSPARVLELPKPTPRKPGPFSAVMAPGGGLLLQRKEIRLSLCMIVRDSARTLPACLESIRPWVDEMVIVDTGSVDETPRIVEEFGGRLFHFPWCDDFSAARNESLRYARGEWLFWMDSDDTIDADCGRRLRELAYHDVDPSLLGYVVQVHCPGGGEDGSLDVTAVDHVKLIRNRPDLRFDGRIHEQILPAIRRAEGDVAWTDLFVVHSGSDPSPEAQGRKRERDLRILHRELQERPEHPFTLFNLGMTYADAERFEEAAEFLVRGIGRSSSEESHLRKAYALLLYAQMRLGRLEEAGATCRRARELFPDDAELRFRQGVLLHDLGCLEESARAYRDVLSNREERHFSSVDRGIFGFKARQNLAVVLAEDGDLAGAEEQWRLVIEEVPRYRSGWRGLGEVLLRRGKLGEIDALIDHLQADDALGVEADLLRGRVATTRGDLAEARRAFDEAVARRPKDLELRHALCQFAFEYGTVEEAEQTLQELARLAPNDASVHHNLGSIALRKRRAGDAVAAFRRSLVLRPDSPPTLVQLGHALKLAGKTGEAIETWKKALHLDPDNPEASEALRAHTRSGSGLHRMPT